MKLSTENNNSLAVDTVAGIAGGIAVVLVGHPFDTVKTLLQTAPKDYYKSTFDCVGKTFREGGFTSFYKGIYSPLMGQMVFRGLSFLTFFQSMKYVTALSSNNSSSFSNNNMLALTAQPMEPSAFQLFVCGSITGFVISFAETPIDLVKTKLQIQLFKNRISNKTAPYNGVIGCTRHIINTSGIKALWQGLGPTMVRNIPANALFFPVNEIVKRGIAHSQGLMDASQLHYSWKLVAGACAGLGYWVTTYPLDVIKSSSQSIDYHQRQSWVRTAHRVYTAGGGIQAFGKGFLPCAARAVPACAAMFATVDVVRSSLDCNTTTVQ